MIYNPLQLSNGLWELVDKSGEPLFAPFPSPVWRDKADAMAYASSLEQARERNEMSLYGYKPKTKPALWTQSPAAKERLDRLKRVQAVLKATRKLLKPIPLIRKRAKAAFSARKRGKAAAKPCRRLRARSSAMEARMKLYRANKARFLAEHPSCQCGCGRKSKEIHHHRGRAGALLLDETYWLALAPECHRWVHEHVNEARERNLIAQPGDWNKTT